MHDAKLGAWIQNVESFPIVPGWKWSETSWAKWKLLLTKESIVHCRDRYGNVLLGAASAEEWFGQLRSGSVRLVLQAHLDHPGALVLKKNSDYPFQYRYTALLCGGLQGNLVGFYFRLFNCEGEYLEDVLIDKQTSGYYEKILSFKTKERLVSPLYLCGPTQTQIPPSDSKEHYGWGMDNHVGCAAICYYFSKSPPRDVLGLLTLDEEVGSSGLHSVAKTGQKHGLNIGDWPLLFSLEVTPEYPDKNWLVGHGGRLRSADRKSKLDQTFLGWGVKNGFGEPLALENGSCEAGTWSHWGGKSGCLVIPCYNYHNATQTGEWREERVAQSDVGNLYHQLEKVTEYWQPQKKDFANKGINSVSPITWPSVRVVEPATLLSKKIARVDDYVKVLREIMPLWHSWHEEVGISLVRFDHSDWKYWSEKLLASHQWFKPITSIAKKWGEKVGQWLGISLALPKEILIYLTVGASFNASNVSGKVVFSTDKLILDDLPRLLCHELTHWWLSPTLAERGWRPLVNTLVQEGLACLATQELLALPETKVLGLSSEKISKYRTHQQLLRQQLLAWLEGELFDIKWDRHEQIRPKELLHPFHTGVSHEWTKYGYLLAFDFLREAKGNTKTWIEWIHEWNPEEIFCFLKKREEIMERTVVL